MGSNASKPVQAAAGAAKRQYPKQAAPPPRVPKAPRSQPSQPPQPPTPAPKPSQAPAPAQAPSLAAQGQGQGQGPQYHSKEKASITKSNAIDLDGRDPDFAASLRSIGPVNSTQGFPTAATRGSMQTVFPSASSPAWLVHTARQRVSKIADEQADRAEIGLLGDRQLADAFAIQQALQMRDVQKLPSGEIEAIMGLKEGFMDKLGAPGVVSRTSVTA